MIESPRRQHEPEMVIEEFSAFGEITIIFNQDLEIPEAIEDFIIRTDTLRPAVGAFRALQDQIDLNNFM